MTDLNYNEIYPNLYQGGEPALELGYIFDYIVFCAEEIQPYEHEFLPAVSLFCPFDDNGVTKPSPSELIEIYETADRVAELVQDGNKVLVTCAAGINRSGLVTALALNKLTGWNGETCVNHVRSKRKHPHYTALYNSGFVEILMTIR